MGLAILTFGGGERCRLLFSSHFFAASFTLNVLKTLVLGHRCTDLSDCHTSARSRALREAVVFSFQYTVL